MAQIIMHHRASTPNVRLLEIFLITHAWLFGGGRSYCKIRRVFVMS